MPRSYIRAAAWHGGGAHGRLPDVSHPSLGTPPPDLTAGAPAAARGLLAASGRLAARALEIAVELDPTMTDRHDETALRQILRDAEALLERIAHSVASGDVTATREFADAIAPLYRRRRVPMDDLVALLEGLRLAMTSVLPPSDVPAADAPVDAAIAVFRAYRRLAGDARKRNRILSFLYKGA